MRGSWEARGNQKYVAVAGGERPAAAIRFRERGAAMRRKGITAIRLVVLAAAITALGICSGNGGAALRSGLASPQFAPPILADPDKFEVELFADFASEGLDVNGFQLTITGGENGFPPGLYVTPGPDQFGDSLLRVDGKDQVSVVTTALSNAESMVFARGSYGDGILITEPRDFRIRRLLADGTLTTFADNVSAPPFGPAVLAYGPGGRPGGSLFATDGSSGSDTNGSRDILEITPEGTRSVFASIPEPLFPECILTCFVQVQKAMAYASVGNHGRWQAGGGLVVGTFSLDTAGPSMIDRLFAISADGSVVTLLTDGLSGVELVELGPGGPFGSDLFVATVGSPESADGALFTVDPSGSLSPFLTNVDAVDVAFDTEGLLGGGMFVSDRTDKGGPGRIWRVVPRGVGGILEVPVGVSDSAASPSEGSGSSPPPYVALAAGAAAALLVLAAGGWYARRRWLR